MKENKYLLSTLLAVVVGLALLICVLIRTFAPACFLPQLDIPAMVLLSLVALLLDAWIGKNAMRCWICIPLLGALTFGLLPFAACFVTADEALKLALLGGVVFTITTLLFTTIRDRLSSGPACRFAAILSACGIFLAAQVFIGM